MKENDIDSAHQGPVIFYDGVCGLCNRYINFVLANTSDTQFKFASLQSAFADKQLSKFNVSTEDLNSVYVLTDIGSQDCQVLSKSDAVIFILKRLKSPFPFFATIISFIPKPLRNLGYSLVAKYRYKFFGKYDTCLLPNSKEAEKFIEV